MIVLPEPNYAGNIIINLASLPDFLSGGILDVEQYEEGNGKVLVRARIDVTDDKILTVRELPFGVTTESLIQSVQDAANKGKLKLSSIDDFTAEFINNKFDEYFFK